MQTYTVQTGDTLYGISKQFGIPVSELKSINNLKENTILRPGLVLKIPTNETTIIYIVKKGDSLYKIAKKYDTTVSEIIRINNLPTTALYIDQELRIPVKEEKNQDYISYTVKKGDSLYSIATKYNTTVNDIKKLNGLTNNNLSIGQILKVPVSTNTTLPETYSTYIVKKGDSLYKIAKKFNMSVEDLIAINNLKSNILTIGQELKVQLPEDYTKEEVTNEECYGSSYSTPTYQTYTVKKGDSLYQIAKRFNTSIESLLSLNDLKSTNLSIGQVLKIKEVTS